MTCDECGLELDWKYEQVVSALKLQEIVKERIKWTLESPLYHKDNFTPTLDELQSLVKESENTVKERGSA